MQWVIAPHCINSDAMRVQTLKSYECKQQTCRAVDIPRPFKQTSVVMTEKCMDKYRHWNMKELVKNTRISGPTAGMHKFSTNV